MEIGIGPTDELSLRVSVAALVRVLFEHPRSGELMLALERKATLRDRTAKGFVEIKSQPFGGALRILDLQRLRGAIGEFHFDSERSRQQEDFRIFIKPFAWQTVQEFCQEHLSRANTVLESDPGRELAEEFAEVLNVRPRPDQWICKPVGTVIENASALTENFYARGALTARIYQVFEAWILDLSLAQTMSTNSEDQSDEDLQELALRDFQGGGSGWANSILTLPLIQLSAFYSATLPEARNRPISFLNHRLDETVAAVLENVSVPKYERR